MKPSLEETLQVPKSLLLKLAENNSFSEEIIKKEFPKLFSVELEVGNYYWVKHDQFKDALVFIQDKEVSHTYGFDHENEFTDIYRNDFLYTTYKSDVIGKATEQEVFEALKNEAIKRGYENRYLEIISNEKRYLLEKEIGKYQLIGDVLYYQGAIIFNNGTWATIIPQEKVSINPLDFKGLNDTERLDLIKSILENY